jgi:hypothetical protein
MMASGSDASDWLLVGLVVVARFLLPLTIPRYPLPGIVASLVLDGVDQTLFQQFTGLSLAGYQGYDKALDIYYLTVAYISTLRNWAHAPPLRVARFLFYWRLVGVTAFELTSLRALLLIFPNTFEYFFVFCEVYGLLDSPRRMTRARAIGAAAFIWIVIKLPQEYWLHIAQADATDWLKTTAFHAALDTPWSTILLTWPGLWVVGLAVVAIGLFAVGWLARRTGRSDRRRLAFGADARESVFDEGQVREAVSLEASRIVDVALVEKIILVVLVGLSFAQVLPGESTHPVSLTIGVAALVVVNTVLSHWLARRGFGWAFTLRQFVILAAVNSAWMSLVVLVRSQSDAPMGLGSALFIALLLALLITLFDRYRQVYLMRFGPGA